MANEQTTPPRPERAAPDLMQGAGYPSEDRDDVDPEDEEDGPDLDEDDDEDEFDDGDDETLNVGAQVAPEEGPVPIEEEVLDLSLLEANVDKAAWNRERVAHLQEAEDAGETPNPRNPSDAPAIAPTGSVGSFGTGGEGSEPDLGVGAPNERVDPGIPGLETGDGILDELEDRTDVREQEHIEDAVDGLDASMRLPDGQPDLPEHRFEPDDGISLEEQLVARDGEDSLLGTEVGFVEDLEPERLNEDDNVSRRFEDDRDRLSDSMDGNERRGGLGAG